MPEETSSTDRELNDEVERRGKDVIKAAATYVRLLAGLGDLADRRIRRRLKLALVELTRIRQIFAPDEATEAAEIPKRAKMNGGFANAVGGSNPFVISAGPQASDPDDEEVDLEDEGEPVREQSPQAFETASQRMIREATGALGPILASLRDQNAVRAAQVANSRAEAVASLTARLQATTDAEIRNLLWSEIRHLTGSEEQPRLPVPVPTVDYMGVHTAHCCLKHGCKYGEADCPVTTGKVKQEKRCEACMDAATAEVPL